MRHSGVTGDVVGCDMYLCMYVDCRCLEGREGSKQASFWGGLASASGVGYVVYRLTVPMPCMGCPGGYAVSFENI